MFCSVECKDRHRHQAVEVPCSVCGTTTWKRRSSLTRGRRPYCSSACYQKFVRATGAQSGANNNNWKGGVSTDNMRYRRRQAEKWPEREKARRMTLQAIRNGSLVRQPCEKCTAIEKVEAHHDDYSKPLDIRWLCSACHDAHHTEERRLERARRAATKARDRKAEKQSAANRIAPVADGKPFRWRGKARK